MKKLLVFGLLIVMVTGCSWKEDGPKVVGAVVGAAASYALGFDPIGGGSYSVLEEAASMAVQELAEAGTEAAIDGELLIASQQEEPANLVAEEYIDVYRREDRWQ